MSSDPKSILPSNKNNNKINFLLSLFRLTYRYAIATVPFLMALQINKKAQFKIKRDSIFNIK